MARGSLTFDFTSLGGERFELPERCTADSLNESSFASYDDIPAPEFSVSGCAEKGGTATPIRSTYEISGSLTERELNILRKGFTLSDCARRSGEPCEFRIEDCREFVHDKYPPERAYVEGTLVKDVTGTVETSMHHAIKNAVFGSYPATVGQAEGMGDLGCLVDVSFVIYEATFLSAEDNGQDGTLPDCINVTVDNNAEFGTLVGTY